MKTLTSLLGAALVLVLVLVPASAHADDAAPTPVLPAAPVLGYSPPYSSPRADGPGAPRVGAPVATRSRSLGLLVGGIAVAGLGTASLVGGIVDLDEARRGSAPCSEICFSALGNDLKKLEGTFFTINGSLMMVGGVAMAIAGGWQVPVRASVTGSLPGAPAVAVGPGNATLKWSF